MLLHVISFVVFVADLLSVQIQLFCERGNKITIIGTSVCARKISLKVADNIGMHAEMFHNKFRFSPLFV